MTIQSKTTIARRQLGAALQLFLDDADPVSVQCLACSGGEIAAGLARSNAKDTFTELAATANTKPLKEMRKIRSMFWNAFKHYYEQDGKTVRQDEELIERFFEDPDHINSADLFMGWYDYMMAGNPLPIEVQVLQIWQWSKDVGKLSDAHDKEGYQELFPRLKEKTRAEQKEALREVIARYRADQELMSHPHTDARPLILPANA